MDPRSYFPEMFPWKSLEDEIENISGLISDIQLPQAHWKLPTAW